MELQGRMSEDEMCECFRIQIIPLVCNLDTSSIPKAIPSIPKTAFSPSSD